MAGILGLSPWQTPLSIYARIVAAQEGRWLEQADTRETKRGRVLESAVLRLYAEETGLAVSPAPGTPPLKQPHWRMSLDAVAFEEPNADARRVVEVKTAGLSEVRHWGEEGTDQIPQWYLFQCAWYLGQALWSDMVDVPAADVAALVGGDLRIYRVPFDPELFSMLEAAAERFWKDHVLPRRPPPATEPFRDADAAAALYPKHHGEARDWSELATEEQRAVRNWLAAREARQAAERLEKQCEAQVRLLLASTPSLKGLPPDTGVRRVDWKQNKPSTVTDWKAVAAWLRPHVGLPEYNTILEMCTTTKEGARPLNAYALKEEA